MFGHSPKSYNMKLFSFMYYKNDLYNHVIRALLLHVY